MTYFKHITSLADLKKQYRKLALANHPDKGGDTAIMQAINTEFEQLFNQWKDRKEVDYNGYENDYTEAQTSWQYTDYVWNEYRWRGSRCGTVGFFDLADEFRKFVKQAYPNCKFSIRTGKATWTPTYEICLEKADFEAFTEAYRKSPNFEGYADIGYSHGIGGEDKLTDRCREVMENVRQFCESFNFDDSDAMVDYFSVGFYSHYYVGSRRNFFQYQPLQLKGGKPEYKRKPTPTERAIQQAIGTGNVISEGKVWDELSKAYIPDGRKWIIKNADRDIANGYPISYSQLSLQIKREAALNEIGILFKTHGRHYISYEILGYTPELQAKLDKERAEEDERERAFYAKYYQSTSTNSKAAAIEQHATISG